MKTIPGGVCAAKGFKANGIHCGIRKNHSKKDLALVVSDVICNAAAVYTTNLVKGAPIAICRENLADGKAQAMICNSGNANTCNANGLEIARAMCTLTADALGRHRRDLHRRHRTAAGYNPDPIRDAEFDSRTALRRQ